MAPRSDRTTRIPSVVASPVTTNRAAKGSVFVNLSNGILNISPEAGDYQDIRFPDPFFCVCVFVCVCVFLCVCVFVRVL